MKTSKAGIELIKYWEGCRLGAYQDTSGVWTVGYGHIKTAKEGMTITHAQADALLLQDLADHEQFITRYVKVPLTQNQFDALSSFIFNLGGGAFSRSTLLKHINNNDYKAAANEFGRWVNVNGKPVKGLINRRAAEREVFARD